MTESEREKREKEEPICSRRGSHHSRDPVHDSDRLYDRVRSARRSLGMTLWILSTFAFLSGISWYLYSIFPRSVQVSTEIPVLLAHPETMMKIESLKNKTAALREKAVVAVPQTPSPREKNAQTVTTITTFPGESASSTPVVVLPVMPAPAAATVSEKQISEKKIRKKIAGTPAWPPLPAMRLQLGSFQRRRDAERAWSQLTHRHGDLLGGIPHAILPVNLGVKGTWYRVYAGPYDNVRRALFVCHTLQERHAHCLFSSLSQRQVQ